MSIYAAIVIPCLNEEEHLAHTCASLGFGIGPRLTPNNAILIIVDNNSVDNTSSVARSVKDNSMPNSVIIEEEKIRGFVPARHRGIEWVQTWAKNNGVAPKGILIIQADADTVYSEGYIDYMRLSAIENGPNVLFTAHSGYAPDFQEHYAGFMGLSYEVDNRYEQLYPQTLTDDCVVDDKAASYLLSDYRNWGGHQREYISSTTEEVFAETTRLYIRARTTGAKRVLVENARVYHSPRKLKQFPLLHFATAGFPREESWCAFFNAAIHGPLTLEDLHEGHSHPSITFSIRTRRLHVLALFSLLPLHVCKALSSSESEEMEAWANPMFKFLPDIRRADLLQPARVLLDVFNAINTSGNLILEQAEMFMQGNPKS